MRPSHPDGPTPDTTLPPPPARGSVRRLLPAAALLVGVVVVNAVVFLGLSGVVRLFTPAGAVGFALGAAALEAPLLSSVRAPRSMGPARGPLVVGGAVILAATGLAIGLLYFALARR